MCSVKTRTVLGIAGQLIHPTWAHRLGRVGTGCCFCCMVGKACVAEGKYLSRWPRHPRGGRSYGQTGPGGGTAPGCSRCLCTSHHPERWGRSHHQTDCFWELPGPTHRPAAGTPPGQQVGPRGHHTLCPRCHHGGSPRAPGTCSPRRLVSPRADL